MSLWTSKISKIRYFLKTRGLFWFTFKWLRPCVSELDFIICGGVQRVSRLQWSHSGIEHSPSCELKIRGHQASFFGFWFFFFFFNVFYDSDLTIWGKDKIQPVAGPLTSFQYFWAMTGRSMFVTECFVSLGSYWTPSIVTHIYVLCITKKLNCDLPLIVRYIGCLKC